MLSKHDSYLILFPLASLGNVHLLSSEGKGFDAEYPDSAADCAPVPTEGIVNGIHHPDSSCVVFDPQFESTIGGNLPKEQPMSEESLRESLKKQFEFCFSRWVTLKIYDVRIAIPSSKIPVCTS